MAHHSDDELQRRSRLTALRDDLLAAQLAGDRGEAARVVLEDGVEAGLPVDALREEVIGGAQREIGRLWEENRISVAQEHVATAISELVLVQLFERCRRAPRVDKKVLVACVEGERHGFPARLAADALELAGFDVIFAGADVPMESLLERIEALQPDLLALSVTMSFHLQKTLETLRAVRDATDGRLPVIIGGHLCAWLDDPEATLGADACGVSGDELLEAARRLTDVAPEASGGEDG